MNKRADLTDIDLELAPLNPALPIPLYHQLYSSLRSKIQSGSLPTGSKIPGEIQLAEQLDISRITVKRALNELAQSGLVSRRRGRGTIVTVNTDLNFKDVSRDYVKNVIKLRETTKAELLTRENCPATQSVALNLGVTENAPVEKIAHTLSMDDKVLSYSMAYLPPDLTESLTAADLTREALLTLLPKTGTIPKRAEQVILPVCADSQLASVLGCREGRPLLKIHCIFYEPSGAAIMDVHAWYHPDRFKYQMTLTDLDGAP